MTSRTRFIRFLQHFVFLTGTAAEVIGVSTIDGDPVGSGKVGPITPELVAEFRRQTRENACEH